MNTNDDIILYDTAKEAGVTPVKTFDLIDPTWPPMSMVLPEFDFSNPPVDPNEFASTLVETCKQNRGLGLSANQCGFPYRVFVMGAEDNFIACFNPKIILAEGEEHMAEGCLSFPLLQLRITRPKTITVEYQDWNGEVHTNKFTGLTARIFLHELDHMNGIMYTDRAKPLALKSGLKKVEKVYRKYFSNSAMKKLQNGIKEANTGRK